ncbi:MAG: sulfurtransferase TusA family protein [Alicyclobacillaceae bacterium]|nr:sulfurtransferase TusA family protein [Alicyclobacillaceae bacterium]
MARHLQMLGYVCPFPLVEAEKAIAEMEPGEELIIDFDCTQATESLPRWAVQHGHQVTAFEQTGDAQWQIRIRKAG